MKDIINFSKCFFERRPKLKQWTWFWGLWLGGFLTMLFVADVIKGLIKICV